MKKKLSSIKVILLNTNGNEFFITNFSSVCFNTFEAQKWNRRGCIHWHLHFAKLTIVIKAAYLRTNRKELLPQKRFFARQYTAGTLSSTLIWQWFIYLLKRYIAVGEANGTSSTVCCPVAGRYQYPDTWNKNSIFEAPFSVFGRRSISNESWTFQLKDESFGDLKACETVEEDDVLFRWVNFSWLIFTLFTAQ